jgi:Flp pilus assembly protein TadG
MHPRYHMQDIRVDEILRAIIMFGVFRHNERGNMAIMMALAIVPVIFAIGIAFDRWQANNAKIELRSASDAAALAAAYAWRENPLATLAQLQNIARDNFEANAKSTAYQVSSTALSWNLGDIKQFSFTSVASLNPGLSSTMGASNIIVNNISTANVETADTLEIALVVDNSHSMHDPVKLNALITASTNLINTSIVSGDDATRIALIPYDDYVNVGLANRNQSWMDVPADYVDSDGNLQSWNGCAGSRNYPLNTRDESYNATPVPGVLDDNCPVESMPLTSNKADLLARAATMDEKGETYIPVGLMWGWRSLSQPTPLAEGNNPTFMDANNGKKILILTAASGNTVSPAYPAHDSNNTALSDALTTEICTAIKADGIRIYAIAIEPTGTSLTNLLKSCASSKATFFVAYKAANLDDIFNTIANKLAPVWLSK